MPPPPGGAGRMEGVRTRLLPAALGLLLVLGGCGGAAVPAASCVTTVPGDPALSLSPEQAANAATIAAVGRRLGLADHAVTVALATAMQESKLRNLAHGDRDSVGLFQQRPSQGWGTAAQVATPSYAAAAFYRRLQQVPGWQDLPVTVAAQAVQHSAYPEAYGAHEGAARVLAVATTGQVPAGLACAHLPAPAGLRDDALRGDAATELGPGGLTATGGAALWTSALWLVAHAQDYGVSSVVAAGRRWTVQTGGWATDPSAGTGLGYR